MKIKKIGIIGGTNGIGASFARFFGQKFPDISVQVSGRNTEITNEDLATNSDLLIFSAPIETNISLIEDLVCFSDSSKIWVDFTSTKTRPMEALGQTKSQICGMHPMFGPNSDITGQKIVFCPGGNLSDKALVLLQDLFFDFEIIFSDAAEHDLAMGVVQGMSHFSDWIMGQAIVDSGLSVEALLKFSSAPYLLKFQVMGRMFAQNPDLYTQIIGQNIEAIEMLKKAFEARYEQLAAGDQRGLVGNFELISDTLGQGFCAQSVSTTNSMFAHYQKKVTPMRIAKVHQSPNPTDIAIFGEAFSHTDEASNRFSFLDGTREKFYFPYIFEVFEAVEKGICEWGIVPYQNSIGGSVFDTLDGLFAHEVEIFDMREVLISQCILGLPGAKLTDLVQVSSHPQAIAQSRLFLRSSLPGVDAIAAKSTAIAAQNMIANADLKQGVIGSMFLAQNLGLDVLAPGVSGEGNKTQFVAIRRKESVFGSKTNTSFVVWFHGDKSGNLAALLNFFADRDINLSKLDSRRATDEYGNYLFFIDAEIGPVVFETFRSDIDRIVGGMKLLGGY